MVDTVRTFELQFEPVEGGYLYYPSAKSGGKLVTHEEYQQLLADWKKATGLKSMLSILLPGFILLAAIDIALELDETARWVSTTVFVLAVVGYFLWVSFAPRRLVKDRPDHTPPRTKEEGMQHARKVLGLDFVLFCLLVSGSIFGISVSQMPEGLAHWAVVLGSGAFFLMYVRLAFQLWADRKH